MMLLDAAVFVGITAVLGWRLWTKHRRPDLGPFGGQEDGARAGDLAAFDREARRAALEPKSAPAGEPFQPRERALPVFPRDLGM